jgi:hypothetical protein
LIIENNAVLPQKEAEKLEVKCTVMVGGTGLEPVTSAMICKRFSQNLNPAPVAW